MSEIHFGVKTPEDSEIKIIISNQTTLKVFRMEGEFDLWDGEELKTTPEEIYHALKAYRERESE